MQKIVFFMAVFIVLACPLFISPVESNQIDKKE